MKKTNKYIALIFILLNSINASGQVSIGKQSINGAGTILDFYDNPDNRKGIILPAFTPINTLNPTNGTFYYNTTEKKVKMFENNTWVNLTDEGSLPSYYKPNNSNEQIASIQKQGVIIGSNTSDAEGVLVLESTTKALLLPKISTPESTVVNPYPGMMCYDTSKKSLAIFDGANWSYWKGKD